MNKFLKTCYGCAYYYVTHLQKTPNGCKKFGFLSQKMPYLLVKESSGTECAYYTQKGAHKNDQRVKWPKKKLKHYKK